MALEHTDTCPGPRVPKARRAIMGRGHEKPPVGTEVDTDNGVFMTLDDGNQFSATAIPKSDKPIQRNCRRAGCNLGIGGPAGAKGSGPNFIGMPF